MIWSWIFQFIAWLVTSLISKLPNVTDTTGFGAAVSSAGHFLAVPVQFAPLTVLTVLPALTFIILFEVGYFAYKGLNWLLRRVPTQS